MPHALRYSRARRRSVPAIPGTASRIKVANGPSHSQPVTSSPVSGVNCAGMSPARLRTWSQTRRPARQRPAFGYEGPYSDANPARGLGADPLQPTALPSVRGEASLVTGEQDGVNRAARCRN